MSGPVAKKSSKNEGAEQTKGRSPQVTQRPNQLSSQADILALQHSAGNRAVRELLQQIMDNAEASPANLPPLVRSVLNRSGQPLDCNTRALMESRFGEDFSQVRLHTDAEAMESAEVVNAQAYTLGHNIVFGESRYMPETSEGRRLLAHELAHVVQQARGGSAAPSLAPDSSLEQDAGRAAEAVMTSGSVQVAAASAPGIARQAKPGATATTEKRYQVKRPDGQVVELGEAEYQREVQNATRSIEIDLNGIEMETGFRRQTHQDYLNKWHIESGSELLKKPMAFFSVTANVIAGVTPPSIDIWTHVMAEVKASRAALRAGNLSGAAFELQTAQTYFADATRTFNTFIERSIGGAEKFKTGLEYTRDISFAIAIATAAVIAAPVVAAGAGSVVSGAGLTGTAATVGTTALTEGTLVAGGGVLGGGLRASTSAAGQKIFFGNVSTKELKKETVQGVSQGMQAASLTRGAAGQVIGTVGSTTARAAGGEDVDWKKAGVQLVAQLLLQRFGPKLASGVASRLATISPSLAALGTAQLSKIALGVLKHAGASAYFAAVDAAYQGLFPTEKDKEKPFTLSAFADEVLARIVDPQTIIFSLFLREARAKGVPSPKGTPPSKAAPPEVNKPAEPLPPRPAIPPPPGPDVPVPQIPGPPRVPSFPERPVRVPQEPPPGINPYGPTQRPPADPFGPTQRPSVPLAPGKTSGPSATRPAIPPPPGPDVPVPQIPRPPRVPSFPERPVRVPQEPPPGINPYGPTQRPPADPFGPTQRPSAPPAPANIASRRTPPERAAVQRRLRNQRVQQGGQTSQGTEPATQAVPREATTGQPISAPHTVVGPTPVSPTPPTVAMAPPVKKPSLSLVKPSTPSVAPVIPATPKRLPPGPPPEPQRIGLREKALPKGHEDILEQHGIQERQKLIGKPQRRSTERGIDVHKYNEALDNWAKERLQTGDPKIAGKLFPSGRPPVNAVPEFEITDPKTGKIYRMDAVDFDKGVIYEMKSNGPGQRELGEAKLNGVYKPLMDADPRYRRPGGWETRVIEYDRAVAEQLLYGK